MTQKDALQKAVEVAGGQSKLADRCGVKQGHVWYWLNRMDKIPDSRVLSIEAATEFQVSRHDLRPDLYPKESWCRCPACEGELRENAKEEAA